MQIVALLKGIVKFVTAVKKNGNGSLVFLLLDRFSSLIYRGCSLSLQGVSTMFQSEGTFLFESSENEQNIFQYLI